MAKIGNLKCKVGSYEKDVQAKGKYVDVGVLMQGQDGGMFVLLNTTFNPAGVPNPENKESILVSVFTDNNQQGQPYSQPQQNGQQQQSYQQPQQTGQNAPVYHEQVPQQQGYNNNSQGR